MMDASDDAYDDYDSDLFIYSSLILDEMPSSIMIRLRQDHRLANPEGSERERERVRDGSCRSHDDNESSRRW